MLENRPIVAIAIGYIIGIIMGLYCKISIVFLYLCFALGYKIITFINSKLKEPKNKKFKLISFGRYFRYVKIVITRKVFMLMLITSLFSNTITLYRDAEYSKIQGQLDSKEITIEAIVVSNVKSSKYKNVCNVKVQESIVDGKKSRILKNRNLYLNISTKNEVNLEYGDRLRITGNFTKPTTRTNYKAFDYKEYLQTLEIYGIIDTNNIMKVNDDVQKLNLRIINI